MTPTHQRPLRFWIAGGAKSGLAAARLLASRGAAVFVSDAGTLSPAAKETLTAAGIGFEDGGHSFDRFEAEADVLVLSPTIPLSQGLALRARKLGKPIVSEIEVASWSLAGNETLIGITGTNGKSTTTAYTAQLLARAGRKAVACGNIGLPFADAVASGAFDAFALELSSYQLETTSSLRLDVGLFLNLQEDHLARYETMDTYLKAKWRLLHLVKDEGLACIDEEALEQGLRLGLPLPRARVVALAAGTATERSTWNTPGTRATGEEGQGGPVADPVPSAAGGAARSLSLEAALGSALERARTLPGALYHDLSALEPSRALGHSFPEARVERDAGGGLRASWQGNTVAVGEPALPGFHNATNILAASVAADAVGVPLETITEQWEASTSEYEHLPHRLEFVVRPATAVRVGEATKHVALVNDSKATNVESTLVALRSFRGGVRLLVGGEPKGESYLTLVPFFGAPVVRFYPFGKAAAAVGADLRSLESAGGLAPASATLLDAATAALHDAADGEIILLSPACASFDEFRNFEHRGDTFKEWARACVAP